MAQDDPLLGHVDEILSAAKRAATLTQSLLAFSRKQVVKPRPVNVNELINHMEKMLLRLIREDIELRTTLLRVPLTVFIDPGQLEQVLVNLATNARDAMPNGGSLIIETRRTWLSGEFAKKYGEVAEGTYVMISVYGHRDGKGDPGSDLRAFFHHQGTGQGDRPRPVNRLRDRHAE